MATEYTIPVELPPEVAQEWEPVRFGLPQKGEHFLDTVSPPKLIVADWDFKDVNYLILRRRYQWPQQVSEEVKVISANGRADDGTCFVFFYDDDRNHLAQITDDTCRLLGVEPPPRGVRVTRPE